jgi:hypothetical protein
MATPRTIKGAMRQTKDNYAQIDRLNIEKDKIDRKIDILRNKNWKDILIRPIAIQMAKHFPGTNMDIMGPFGLSAEVNVLFKKKGVADNDLFKTPQDVRSISFRPGDLREGKILIVDTNTNTRHYAKNTIGDINGMNHPSIPITSKMSVKDLVKYVH